jgi:hypothetical protein
LFGITDVSQLANHYARGGIFKSLIISQVYKQRYNNGTNPVCYFWRDHAGHEVDLLIEEQLKLTPVEIKSAHTINSKFFANLQYWYKITDTQIPNGYILYAGDAKQTWQYGTVLRWQETDTIITKDIYE